MTGFSKRALIKGREVISTIFVCIDRLWRSALRLLQSLPRMYVLAPPGRCYFNAGYQAIRAHDSLLSVMRIGVRSWPMVVIR